MTGAQMVKLYSVVAMMSILFLGACAATSQLPAKSASSGPSREVLANGLRLIIQEHPASDVVALHVWVGVGLAYYCLCLFLNSTRVELKEGTLTVQHSPLWWRGNRKLSASELQQLFVVEKRGSKGSVSYELCALSCDGKRQTLLTGLSDESSARFLEVRLEQALNITDQAVAGELRR